MKLVDFDPASAISDLDGKVIVVTGGNAGLGAETIRQLAVHRPARIYLCARSLSKASAFIAEIPDRQKVHTSIKAIQLDLSSLASVQKAAAEIASDADRLDILFLNAGVSVTQPSLTQDGYEWQFGVNYLAHALFAQLLLPIMLKSAQAKPARNVRIISVSSEAANMFAPKGGLVLKDAKTDMSAYSGTARYGQSKLANVLFAKKLAQAYPSIKSISIHPGLVRTENESKGDGAGWFSLVWKLSLYLTGLEVEDGAKNQLWAAVSPEAESGKFYFPVGEENAGGKYGNDQALIDELWKWTTRELVGHGTGSWPLSQ